MRPRCRGRSVLLVARPRNHLFFPINIDRNTRSREPCVLRVDRFWDWARITLCAHDGGRGEWEKACQERGIPHARRDRIWVCRLWADCVSLTANGRARREMGARVLRRRDGHRRHRQLVARHVVRPLGTAGACRRLFLLGAFFTPLVFLGGPMLACVGMGLCGLSKGAQDTLLKPAIAPLINARKRTTRSASLTQHSARRGSRAASRSACSITDRSGF